MAKRKLPSSGTFFVSKQGNLMVRRGKSKKGDWISLSPRECKKPKKGESKQACAKRVFAQKGIVFGRFISEISYTKGGKKAGGKSSGKLTSAQRKAMPAGKFVFPKGTKADPGKKKFPIHNAQHARSALSRASNKQVKLTQGERCQVMRAVCKKYPQVGMCAAPERKKQSKLLKSC